VVVLGAAPTPAASLAALVIAVVLAWSLVRPAPTRTLGVGRRLAVAFCLATASRHGACARK